MRKKTKKGTRKENDEETENEMERNLMWKPRLFHLLLNRRLSLLLIAHASIM